MSNTRLLFRGLVAANAALVGAFYLFLLHAPAQVLNGVSQGIQGDALRRVDQEPNFTQMAFLLAIAFASLAFSLATFFLFPLLQGGILGQVRDRIEQPQRSPGEFWPYAKKFYVRLLGNIGFLALAMLVLMLPIMGVGTGLAIHYFTEVERLSASVDDVDGGAPSPPFDSRALMLHPAMLVGMGIASLLASAISMVFWVACAVVVAEGEGVCASWRRSMRFCRQNPTGVLLVWLATLAVGVLISPLGLLGPLGIVKEPLILAGIAIIYAALVGYAGVLVAGLIMSLYLARRSAVEEPQQELVVV